MDHIAALENYVRCLNLHDWPAIEPLLADDVVFIFSEGTFTGKAAAKQAFEKTFAHIQEEEYRTTDLTWTAVTPAMASCHYRFHWSGKVAGKAAQGSGRGTSILIKPGGRWLIAHEHLGPREPA